MWGHPATGFAKPGGLATPPVCERGHVSFPVPAYLQQLTFRLKGNDEKEQEKKELNFSLAIVYRAGNLVG